MREEGEGTAAGRAAKLFGAGLEELGAKNARCSKIKKKWKQSIHINQPKKEQINQTEIQRETRAPASTPLLSFSNAPLNAQPTFSENSLAVKPPLTISAFETLNPE